MAIDAVGFRELSADDLDQWARIVREDDRFSSPFFQPGFHAAVAALQPGVEVGRIREGGRVVGFFPFQRTGRHAGGPVGGKRSNYQGVIAGRDAQWDVPSLLRGSRLHLWSFDHLRADQRPFARFHGAVAGSPVIELTGGHDDYVRRLEAAGSGLPRRMRQHARRLERALGPMRFEAHSTSVADLRRLLRWKSDQYVRSGGEDKFAIPWVNELLRAIHATDTPPFAGVLSTLHAGDRLVAAHLGMRSTTEWHYWFPAYDPTLATLSPGLVLLWEMTRAAPALGLHRIDLGRGRESYKDRFKTGEVLVAEGTAWVPSFAAAVRATRRAGRRAARSGVAARIRGRSRAGDVGPVDRSEAEPEPSGRTSQ